MSWGGWMYPKEPKGCCIRPSSANICDRCDFDRILHMESNYSVWQKLKQISQEGTFDCRLITPHQNWFRMIANRRSRLNVSSWCVNSTEWQTRSTNSNMILSMSNKSLRHWRIKDRKSSKRWLKIGKEWKDRERLWGKERWKKLFWIWS